MIKYSDYIDAMSILGFISNDEYTYSSDNILCTYKTTCITIQHSNKCYATTDIANIFDYIESAIDVSLFKMPITAAINTKNLAQNLVRVRSSNVWAIGFNVREKGDAKGDLIIQFKGRNGGGSDVYIYYDVPITLYRRFQSANSPGHFVWQYIRNNFKYSRLTGTKRGVLPNAINNW